MKMILSQYYRVSIEIHIIVFKKINVENLPFIANNAALETYKVGEIS